MLSMFVAVWLSQAAGSAFGPVPGVQLQDEGTAQGQVVKMNFAGAGVTCARSGGTGTCTIAGGGAASLSQAEIDFGVSAKFVATLVVTDATVSATSKIIASQGGIAATGRQADENEMDEITCRAIPATGSFTLICSSARSVTHGKFKVFYTVG